MSNAKRLTKCAWCGNPIMRKPFNHNTGKPIARSFCNTACKGQWQLHFDKPNGVNMEWLIQKYEIEKLDCAEIGRMVGRDTKSVWNWLRGMGIRTRGRGSSNKKQWDRGDRTPRQGTPHSDASKQKIRDARIKDGHVPYRMPDGSHYMKGRRGEAHHNWKGGLTPEREAFYRTDEWISAVKAIWHRANAKCERCGADHRAIDNRKKDGFHIHHIRPFRVEETRAELSNLILLCRPCHYFVHSAKNTSKELIDVRD